MINVTQAAIDALTDYFRTAERKPVRIFLTQGCGGQRLAMALDETKESDSVCTAGDHQIIMDRTLLEEAKPVDVDYSDMGFKIASNLELGGGCQSCGTAGSCCSS